MGRRFEKGLLKLIQFQYRKTKEVEMRDDTVRKGRLTT